MMTPTIKDDCGRTVPLFSGEGKLGSHADRVLWGSLDKSRSRSLGVGEIVWGAAILMVIIGGFTVNFVTLPEPIPGYLFWPVLFVSCVVLGLFAMRSMKQHQSWRIRAALLQAGLCSSCGYPLPGCHTIEEEVGWQGAAPASDVKVVCPECGAAWNLMLRDPTGAN